MQRLPRVSSLGRPLAGVPAAAAASPPPPSPGGGRALRGLFSGGGRKGSLLVTGHVFFPSPQLLPRRTDWTGKEHPRSYESLVREAARRRGAV